MQSPAPLTISSIAQIHAVLGKPPPAHPLVTVIGAYWQPPLVFNMPLDKRTIHSQLFSVSLKRGDECRMAFGGRIEDGRSGTLLFLAPGQSFTPTAPNGTAAHDDPGWTVIFDPALMTRPPEHSFFRYSDQEALHLDEGEQQTLTALVRQLDQEALRAPDGFSSEVLCAHVELLLSYCGRFYARQFQTRAVAGESVQARLRRCLDEWLASARDRGLPTVADCARALHYSADYLSDLLRAETGESAREHIHRALIEAAKHRLATTTENVSEIAYALGFEQPQHFSKLFKQKTGSTPGDWRKGASSV
jgi:AraC family transcriptional activator of pobA